VSYERAIVQEEGGSTYLLDSGPRDTCTGLVGMGQDAFLAMMDIDKPVQTEGESRGAIRTDLYHLDPARVDGRVGLWSGLSWSFGGRLFRSSGGHCGEYDLR
jgi:hypothetical protein